LKNLQMKMTNEEIQDAIHTKAYSKITFIEMQVKSLQKELPVGAYTQEMIDNQIRFNKRNLQVWNKIMELNG
jgi:hypothetical protein